MRSSTAPRLTAAERLVMEYHVSGMSRECIAAEMALSCHTVAMHLRNVKLKLGAHNMAQAGKRYGDIVRIDDDEPSDTRSLPLRRTRRRPKKITTSGNGGSPNTLLR